MMASKVVALVVLLLRCHVPRAAGLTNMCNLGAHWSVADNVAATYLRFSSHGNPSSNRSAESVNSGSAEHIWCIVQQ